MASEQEIIHPAWIRAMHWINAITVLVLVSSGWKIYNATAFLGFAFPRALTWGGWLGGALLWHFAAIWFLAINGTAYLALNGITKRVASKFFPLSLKDILSDFSAALGGQLIHADPRQYNAVQRVAYLFVMLDSVLLVVSGLVLWKSVQFPLLRTVLGGYEGARLVHFAAMSALVIFVMVHVVMVLLVPRTLLSMVRGR